MSISPTRGPLGGILIHDKKLEDFLDADFKKPFVKGSAEKRKREDEVQSSYKVAKKSEEAMEVKTSNKVLVIKFQKPSFKEEKLDVVVRKKLFIEKVAQVTGMISETISKVVSVILPKSSLENSNDVMI